MPITLACLNPGGTRGKVCAVTKLVFQLHTDYFPGGHVVANWAASLILTDSGGTTLATTPYPDRGGDYTFDLSSNLATILARWQYLAISIDAASSALQYPLEYPGAIYTARWGLVATYSCVDLATGLTVDTDYYLYNAGGAAEECNAYGDLTAQLLIGSGSALANVFATSPLGCHGVSGSAGGFTAPPGGLIDTGTTGLCLYASGGTTPYTYAIVGGHLGSGQTLNAATGCIEGTWDGIVPPSSEITFQVMDATGATARVTCGIAASGGAPAIGNSFY